MIYIITFGRFLQAVNKVNVEPGNVENTITIKSGYDLHKLKFEDIIYIQRRHHLYSK